MRCRMAVCCAEEAGRFAVTAGVAGESGEAFEDVGNARYASISAARASASWASRSACSGSPCAIATRARVVSARNSQKPVVVDTASSAQRRAAARSPSASAASAFQVRCMPPRHRCRTLGYWRAASRASCAARTSPAARAANPPTHSSATTANLPPSSAPASRVASAAARAAAASPW